MIYPESVFADSEDGSQHQNDEHTQRNPSILHIFFAKEEEAGDDHANNRSGQHQENASSFNIPGDGTVEEHSRNESRQHDKETRESTGTEHDGDDSVEGRFSELAHTAPFAR